MAAETYDHLPRTQLLQRLALAHLKSLDQH